MKAISGKEFKRLLEMKPNIVFILADDMGYGDMGCNNPESKIPTSNLDKLASQGMRFTDAHAPSSVCTPSRYAILTGRHCWRSRLKSGVLWPWDGALIEPGRLTVAEMLRRNGYKTACIGKWHLGWNWQTRDGSPAAPDSLYGVMDKEERRRLAENIDFTKPMSGGPVNCGFDCHFGLDVPNFPPYTWIEQDRIVDPPTIEKPGHVFGDPGPMAPNWTLEGAMPEITRRSVRFIEESSDTPFFLFFALTAPHTPIVPNREFLGKSGAGEYGDFVVEVDWAVGQVMDALERKGIAENTLVIFTSDNGPEYFAYDRIRESGHCSMGDLRGIKRDVWEGGHRVPFIARWPDATPLNSQCDQFVQLQDLMATCAQIVGAEIPEHAGEDSVSFLPQLRGNTTEPVRNNGVHHSMRGRFAIRKGDWVFIDSEAGNDADEPEWFKQERGYTAHNHPGELYNLKEDLSERVNRFAEEQEIVAEMKALLESAKAAGETSPGIVGSPFSE